MNLFWYLLKSELLFLMSLDISLIGNIPLSGLVFRSWCLATTLGTTFWVWCDLWRLPCGNSFKMLQFIESDNAFDNKHVHSLLYIYRHRHFHRHHLNIGIVWAVSSRLQMPCRRNILYHPIYIILSHHHHHHLIYIILWQIARGGNIKRVGMKNV